MQVSFAVMATLSQLGAANDLSLTQLRVLAILRDHEPRMAELASHLGLDKSTVSGLVDRSAQRGLVTRVADADDKRASRVRLTTGGHALADRLAAEIGAEVNAMLSHLDRADRSALQGLLSRVLALPVP